MLRIALVMSIDAVVSFLPETHSSGMLTALAFGSSGLAVQAFSLARALSSCSLRIALPTSSCLAAASVSPPLAATPNHL
ncbi:hypothetical protein D3C87_1581860 [compost metagenome]